MSGKAAKIQLTTCMYEILDLIANSGKLGKAVVTRARFIQMAFDKQDNTTIARANNVCRDTVGKWRQRWKDSFPALMHMQFAETKAAFQRAIIECLSDAPRSGSPGKYTAEQIVELISVACEPPE